MAGTTTQLKAESNLPVSTWYRAGPAQAIRGSVLVLHGLNNRPEIMLPLIRELNEKGFDALLVTLHGHNAAAGGGLAAAGSADWAADAAAGCRRLGAESRGRRRVLLGYSLGGIVGLDFILHGTKEAVAGTDFSRIVLLAPPISLSLRTALIRLLLPGRFLNLALPSLAPAEFRLEPATPLSAYSAAYSLVQSVSRSDSEPLRTIPARVFIAAGDEMVSAAGIRRWIVKNRLADWRVIYLEPKPEAGSGYDHLIFDPAALGRTGWSKMLQEIGDFLD